MSHTHARTHTHIYIINIEKTQNKTSISQLLGLKVFGVVYYSNLKNHKKTIKTLKN